MHIIIGQKPPVQNEGSKVTAPIKPIKRVGRKDLRKNKQDRRQSLRDGVIVSLSFKKDRRKSRGRRKTD